MNELKKLRDDPDSSLYTRYVIGYLEPWLEDLRKSGQIVQCKKKQIEDADGDQWMY